MQQVQCPVQGTDAGAGVFIQAAHGADHARPGKREQGQRTVNGVPGVYADFGFFQRATALPGLRAVTLHQPPRAYAATPAGFEAQPNRMLLGTQGRIGAIEQPVKFACIGQATHGVRAGAGRMLHANLLRRAHQGRGAIGAHVRLQSCCNITRAQPGTAFSPQHGGSMDRRG